MPFVSDSQRRYLFANKPAVAKEFASKTPENADLPEHRAMKKVLTKYQNQRGNYGSKS